MKSQSFYTNKQNRATYSHSALSVGHGFQTFDEQGEPLCEQAKHLLIKASESKDDFAQIQQSAHLLERWFTRSMRPQKKNLIGF